MSNSPDNPRQLSRRDFLRVGAVIGGGGALAPFLKALSLDAQAAGSTKPKYGPTPEDAVSKKRLPVLLGGEEGRGVLKLGELEVQETQYIDGTTNGRDKRDIEEALNDISGVLERSGLRVVVRKVVVLDPSSSKLKPKGYGVSMDEHRMSEALATVYINRGGLELDFSSGNSPKRERELTTMHEVGHGLDIGLNPYLKEWLGGGSNGEIVGDLGLRAEQEYRATFPSYLEKRPIFSYESAVIASKSLDIGQKMWLVFVENASGSLPFFKGSTYVIPEDRIAEAAERYPAGSVFHNLLLRRARIGTPDVIKGFSAKDLGLGLVVDALGDLSSMERDFGEEVALGIKQAAEDTVATARKEMYAELFAQQMVNGGGGSESFPLTRKLQSFITSGLQKLGK